MAVSSGQVNTNVSNNNYFWLKWSQSGNQDIANNLTRIYWEAGCTLGYNYYSNAIRMSAVPINGTQVYGGGTYSNLNTGSHVLASGYLDIPHNPDGSKSFTVGAFTGWLYSNNNYSASAQDFELPRIPRASSITATDANIGSVSSININTANSDFRHTIDYSFGNASGRIATKTSQTSIGWTIPTSLFQQIPNGSYGTVTLTCYTYSGDTHIGTKTTTMTVYVPTSGENNSTPVITNASAIDTNASTLALTGNNKRLVLYKSTVLVSATGQCKNYAGFRSFKENNIYDLASTTSTTDGITTVNGSRVYSSSSTPAFDKTQFKLHLIDTRNIPSDAKILNQANGDFTIIPYVPLTINANVKRVSATSSSVYLNFSGVFYNGYYDANNNNFNDLTIKWRYKEVGGSWITTGADDATNGWHNLTKNTHFKYGSGNTYYSGNGNSQGNITIANLFDYQKQYVFEIYYKDSLSEYLVQKDIPKGLPVHDEGVDANGNNYFWINADTYERGHRLSYSDCVHMHANDQLYVQISSVWVAHKIPLDVASTLGNALSFDSTNKRIVANESGFVDFVGQLNIYAWAEYVQGDYVLQLYKNGYYCADLDYQSINASGKGLDTLMGVVPNVMCQAGDYFELVVVCGGTGTVRTFGGGKTGLTAKFRRS